jgi:hypothetical protein
MTVFEYVKQIYKQLKAKKDCPFNEPLHYHHDGCPACYEQKWQDHWESINDDLDCASAVHYFDDQQYWEDRADNNPDDGSWVGR